MIKNPMDVLRLYPVRKGKRKQISDYAASQGKSMNRFINDAIDAQMPPEKTEK